MIEYLEDIRQHFEEWYPKEGCGILLASKGKISWHPCNNVAAVSYTHLRAHET